jgi:hypothetical protein
MQAPGFWFARKSLFTIYYYDRVLQKCEDYKLHINIDSAYYKQHRSFVLGCVLGLIGRFKRGKHCPIAFFKYVHLTADVFENNAMVQCSRSVLLFCNACEQIKCIMTSKNPIDKKMIGKLGVQAVNALQVIAKTDPTLHHNLIGNYLAKNGCIKDMLPQLKKEAHLYLEEAQRMVDGAQFTIYLSNDVLSHKLQLLQFVTELHDLVSLVVPGKLPESDLALFSSNLISLRPCTYNGREVLGVSDSKILSLMKQQARTSRLGKILHAV